MKRILIIIGILFLFDYSVYAQDYTHALGIRGGLFNGFTYKQFISEFDAVELLATSRWRGLNLTALYERHADLKNFTSGIG